MKVWSRSAPRFGIAACILFLFNSCFQERIPEKPADKTDWLSPTEVPILLENLSKSVATLNLNNYQRCFKTEGYHFQADPDLAANNQGLFGLWKWEKENQFFFNLHRSAQPLSNSNVFTYSNKRENNVSADSVELTANYQLAVYHQDTVFKAVNFQGLLTLQLKRNAQNEWQIVQWRDNKTGEFKCISDLKQRFFAP